MRAPPFARMAAVAAPRPDADPVTIAHKPSFDIPRFLLLFFDEPCGGAYHIARQSLCKSEKLRCAEFILCLMIFMPLLQAALRTALVTAMAFAHHKAQEKLAPRSEERRVGTEC